MPEIGVLALVPDAWSTYWQPRHYVLCALARFFEVVWMNPPHARQEIGPRLRRPETSPSVRQTPSGFTVYTPEPWLPLFRRPRWLNDLTFRDRLRRARAIVKEKNCEKVILYLWRPKYHRALHLADHDASFYHIDDEYSFSSVEVPIGEKEHQLLKDVDHVFIHSPALLEKKGRINPSTSFVPNGVNYSLHSERCPEPSDLTRIPRPRIGYTGWLKSQLNWPALIELAKRHRSWSFVFVGGLRSGHDVEHHLRELSDLPNAHFLGSKKTDEIAAYPQHFDACIMPYREDGYTKFIYPLKLHEYLASGKPTVGTRIPSLVEFSDVVHLCHGVEEWSAKLTEALSPASNTPEQCQLRQDVARSHDWHDITEQIARTMASKLGTEYAQRLDELTDEAARQAGTSSGQRSKICSAGTRSLAETHDTAKTD